MLNINELNVLVEKIRKSVVFFTNFESSELIEILKASTLKKVKAGEVIFKEGEPGDTMFIIVYGTVSIQRNCKEIASLTTGSCFGEMGIIDRSPRTADAKVEKESLLVLVDEKILNSTDIDLRLKLYKNFAQILAQRLRAMNKEI